MNYSATDVGGGVYRHRLLVDGQEVASGPVDANGGRCVRYPVGNGFSSPVPCRTTVSGSLSYDTSGLADGAHDFELDVFDATDENKAVSTWTVQVGAGTPGGGGAGAGATGSGGGSPAATASCPSGAVVKLLTARKLLRSYRRSRFTLKGRLTAAVGGPAVGGATLDILQTVRRSGVSQRNAIGTVKARPDGSFATVVRSGPTRAVRVGFHGCAAIGQAIAERVRGALQAKTTTHRVRNKQTARFLGRVLGGYVGRGLPLELQVRVGPSWKDVKAVTTNSHGAYRVNYRFLRTYVRYTYRFRVVSRAGSSWPFLPARSTEIRVRVN